MLGPVEIVDEIDSTNRALVARARAGAPAGSVLVAEHQTAGRGRLDRTWESAPGQALLVSVLLRPHLAPGDAHLVTVAAGLAAVDACAAVGVDAELKWPNDVLVGARKVAGILSEALLVAGALDAVVVGMGLNLADGPHLPDTATSLARELGAAVGRDAVLTRWLEGLDRRLAQPDPGALLVEYAARCATIGRRVRIEAPDGACEGVATGVTGGGHLVVDVAGGGERTFGVGDVTHLRPV